MRMWMVDPRILCRKHLLGEHVEHHMFVGSFKKRISIENYVKNNLVEPLSIIERHDILVEEIKRRNYNHNSALDFDICLLDYLKREWLYNVVDQVDALDNLIRRCSICATRYQILVESDDIPHHDNFIERE